MFCYQCEQTAKGNACTVFGVCGKNPEVAAMQDVLMYTLQGLAMYAHRARAHGVKDAEMEQFVEKAIFSTLTNTNFDPARFEYMVKECVKLRARAKQQYEEARRKVIKNVAQLAGPASWEPGDSYEEMLNRANEVSIESFIKQHGETKAGIIELIKYGLKGVAAYAYHARILGESDPDVNDFFFEALDFVSKPEFELGELLTEALKVGEINLKTMELLDKAHTRHYGHPEPTQVKITPVKGKAILISGHDLKDLEELLKQTEGKGINIYTHGEMLPAHGYPGLKKYKHLAGNYGGAWQNQHKEFDEFPGAILMTTNCIQKPRDTYKDRIYTSGPTGWPGVKHITGLDFSAVIEKAEKLPGFTEVVPPRTITVGFGHNAVINAAGKVIELVKSGKLRHFFLVGGCDGAKLCRNYYTEFAQQAPRDTVILTLACGKYRFNKMDFGDIDGLPRLLDVGQCNDAYSAVMIASALADAFDVGVNELPLSLILSWFEQKAVAILLTLLHLGIRDIRLGPTLPAF